MTSEKFEEINFDELSREGAKELADGLGEEMERKFWNKYNQKKIERMEEKTIDKKEKREEGKDIWKDVRCNAEFQKVRGEIPLECPKCGKSSNKTSFKALTGPYQYFDLGDRKRFEAVALAEDVENDHDFVTNRDSDILYFYEDGVYKKGGDTLIQEVAQKRLGTEAKNRRVNETVEAVRRRNFVDSDKFGNPVHHIVVENGMLDLDNHELKDHRPEHIHLAKIPVEYDPSASCPKIEEFLSDIVEEEDIPIIQEMIGYCLFKEYPFSKAIMLLGEGANGKSTLLSLIEKFIGKRNIVGPSLHDLIYNKFASSELYHKLANIHADLESGKLGKSGKFKMLTGGDMIRGEEKYGDAFYFQNHAKLLFSANHLPGTDDISNAFFRRWIVIDFPNTFREGDEGTDPNILDKITTDEELSGLLNYALKGLDRIREQNGFTQSNSMEQVKKRWMKETNSLFYFCEERIEIDRESFVTKSDFHDAYKKWCGEEDLEILTKQKVGSRLPTLVPEASEFKPQVDNKQTKAWKGIKLIDEKFKDYNHTISSISQIHSNRSSNRGNKSANNKKESFKGNDMKDIDDFNNEKTIKQQIQDSLKDAPEGKLIDDIVEEVDEVSVDDIKKALEQMKRNGVIRIEKEFGAEYYILVS